MSETKDGDRGETAKQNGINWTRVLCAIGLFIVALLALPPLPPWFGTLTAATAILAALWLLGVLPFSKDKMKQLPQPLRVSASQWSRASVVLALLVLAILLTLAVPPHLRFAAIFMAALAVFAALGWLSELRADLRRWFGEGSFVGKADGGVSNSDAKGGATPDKIQ